MTTLTPQDMRLDDRAPENAWLTTFPERLTGEWLDARFDELLQLAREAGEDAGRWVEVVRAYNELQSHFSTVAAHVRLAFRQHTQDEPTVAENKRLNSELMPVWLRRDYEFSTELAAAPVRPALEREFGAHWLRMLDEWLRTNDPVNIPLRTELSDVLMEYTSIFGTATFTWRGRELPLSHAMAAMRDTDRDERHAAHNSVLAFLQRVEPELQRIFDTAFALRTKMAANLDLPSYVELRYLEMQRFDWNPNDAARFRAAVQEHVVPLARRLRERQARAQGVDLVHPADLQVWPGEPTPELSVDVPGQVAAASRVFHSLGAEFGGPFDELVDRGLIDLAARPGKGTGAFCTSFSDHKLPFLFCNSVGSPDDISTLVHEYGHGLQSWRSNDIELVALRHPTLEACEIHSMTLELLVHPYLEEFFTPEGASQYRREHLRDTLLIVPYIASVDEFQHELYRGELRSADERNALWAELTSRYRPGIDWANDPYWHKARWLRQLHIFQQPFYYLDYALARMVSWQLWLASLEDAESAHATYLQLCSAGGTTSFRELVRGAGLADPFDSEVVADTMRRLEPMLFDA